MRAPHLLSVPIALLTLILLGASSHASPCIGDCDVDAVTGVGEVVRCVAIALGVRSRDDCRPCDQNDDGSVTIDEMIRGVERSLGDCQAPFAEAAAGVSSSAMDSTNALQVLNFGALGAFPTSFGGGAGTSDCVRCPGGGQVTSYSCLSDNEQSEMEAVLDSCRDGRTTRSGRLRLEIDDPAFCVSCRVRGGTTGVQTLSSYTEVTAGGPTLSVAKTLTEAFTVTGAGCRGADRPDRVARLDGTLRVSTDAADSLFTFSGLTSRLTSARVIQELCTITTTLDGTFQVEDFVNGRTFVQSSTEFRTVETTGLDGTRSVTLDTLRDGFLDVDCLGGPVRLTTTQLLLFPLGAPCASEGRLEFEFPNGARSAVQAIVEGGSAGLAFDFDADGVVDRRADSCQDASIAQCRVPLQGVLLAKSDFARDSDSWEAVGDATTPRFLREDGNPGGHICAVDRLRGDTWYWSAPAAFLGDVSAAYRGALRFDLEQHVISVPFADPDVVLEGINLRLEFDLTIDPASDWTSYVVPLDESAGWINESTGRPPTPDEMRATLAALEALLIRGEYNEGPDETCLDNAVLSGPG